MQVAEFEDNPHTSLNVPCNKVHTMDYFTSLLHNSAHVFQSKLFLSELLLYKKMTLEMSNVLRTKQIKL